MRDFECNSYTVTGSRAPLKELEQRRDSPLLGVAKELYLGASLGLFFLIIKSGK